MTTFEPFEPNKVILNKIKSLNSHLSDHAIPPSIKSNMMYLDCLYSELVRVHQQEYMENASERISNQIEKVLVQLIIKFSNNTLSNPIVEQFSDIIIMHIEQKISERHNIDGLANIFGKMSIDRNLVEEMDCS